MNYREKIKKAIACPQFGDKHYGEWGILRYDQRVLIKRLLDNLDNADECIFKLHKENKQLKEEKQELIDYLKEQIKEQEYKLTTLNYSLDIVHTRSRIITYKGILSKIEKE